MKQLIDVNRPVGRRKLAYVSIVFVLFAACSPTSQAPGGSAGVRADPAGVADQRPLTIGFAYEPALLEPSLLQRSQEQAALATATLAYFNAQGQPLPYLAEELPSVERGTWIMLPDGRMETTYRIKKNALWHDGQPVTAHDFVFARQVRLDPNLPVREARLEQLMSDARAIDDHTLFLEWKNPYLWAGAIHLPQFTPMPRHRLEPMYGGDRELFVNGPHWREEFVGSGPYRIDRWEPGVEMVFRAHHGFVLGEPAIKQIVLKLIPDGNVIVAGLLGGSLDMAFVPHIGFSQGQAIEQSGWEGQLEHWLDNPRFMEFQGRDWGNLQRAVLDVRVRRAAMHAINRQGLVDLFNGKAPPYHFWLHPTDPAFAAVDRTATKYEYDPTRAEALLREAGWIKGADGIARDATGAGLDIPIINQTTDIEQQEAAVVMSDWKSVGITSEVQRLSPLQLRDAELRSKFRGVAYNVRSLSLEGMVWTSDNFSTPENRWSGQNRIGYGNPELDRLWLKVLGSIDAREREANLVQAIKVMTDDAVVNITHIQVGPMVYVSRLAGPQAPSAQASIPLWNIWAWRWGS